jgi:lysozyme family protein
MNFDSAFDRLIGHEGGYAWHPSDPGGETMWGVTQKVAVANGYTGRMRDLPRDKAKEIYRAKYWDAVQADKLPEALRFEVFDAAVNSGVSQAVQWLQRIAGVNDDGVLGPMTLDAVAKLNGYAAAAAYNGTRLCFMTNLPTWGSFSRGWARRIAENLKALA